MEGAIFSQVDFNEADLRGAVFNEESVFTGEKTISSLKKAKGVNLDQFCIESYPSAANVPVCHVMPQTMINAISCNSSDDSEPGPTCEL